MKSDITKEMTKEEFIKALMFKCGWKASDAIRYANKIYGE